MGVLCGRCLHTAHLRTAHAGRCTKWATTCAHVPQLQLLHTFVIPLHFLHTFVPPSHLLRLRSSGKVLYDAGIAVVLVIGLIFFSLFMARYAVLFEVRWWMVGARTLGCFSLVALAV